MCIDGLYLRRCIILFTFILNIFVRQFYKVRKCNIGRFCVCLYISKSTFTYLIGKI